MPPRMLVAGIRLIAVYELQVCARCQRRFRKTRLDRRYCSPECYQVGYQPVYRSARRQARAARAS